MNRRFYQIAHFMRCSFSFREDRERSPGICEIVARYSNTSADCKDRFSTGWSNVNSCRLVRNFVSSWNIQLLVSPFASSLSNRCSHFSFLPSSFSPRQDVSTFKSLYWRSKRLEKIYLPMRSRHEIPWLSEICRASICVSNAILSHII